MGFATAAAFACAVAYFSVAAFAFLTPGAYLPPIPPILGELAMTVLFYPPSTLAVGWLHHRLVGALRGDI